MKYHIVFKFLAVLLCTCCLFVSIGASIGIFALEECGLYDTTVDQLRLEAEEQMLSTAAKQIVKRYVIYQNGDLPEAVAEAYIRDFYGRYDFFEDMSQWGYTIEDENGRLLDEKTDQTAMQDAYVYTRQVTGATYPVVLEHIEHRYTHPDTEPLTAPTEPQVWLPEQTVSQDALVPDTVQPADENSEYLYFENWSYGDADGVHSYWFGICQAPGYKVTLYLPNDYGVNDHWYWELAEFGYANRYNVIWVLGASLLLFAVFFVYLCSAAGRKPKREEVCPGGLNRIPLDLYGACAGTGVVLLAVGGFELIRWNMDYYDPQWLLVLAVCAMAFVACLLVVAFFFACAAQFKMRQFYWAKHSVTGLVLIGTAKLLACFFRWLRKQMVWLGDRVPALFQKLYRGIRKLAAICLKIILLLWELVRKLAGAVFTIMKKMLRSIWHGVTRFFQLLPLTWQWLLVGVIMTFVLLLGLSAYHIGLRFLSICFCIFIVMYGAHCFGILLESTKRMSEGELNTKVDNKLMLGSFQEYATHLNALADVAVEAARKQMKSERMKAELVTNVSHDIKTPLTSIINYVDLLQRAESEEQTQEYLEVLNRQSQRLKKLIEDLMEMSKASTGNITVELTQVDAVEAINQALGEFSEKLEMAQLTPVFSAPPEPMTIIADGRLTWRVLSNLLGNAVKYALPGTRLYIDLVAVEGQVLISLKNISKEQLNVSSDELMERFVRGDTSRNTEGSGLGLNIAKSLMELQRGQLQLLVDGDLFKATLIFPCE